MITTIKTTRLKAMCYRALPTPCGTFFPTYSGADPKDPTGCTLPDGHSGPHQFTTTNGVTYLWETDWECTCEECMSGESDYCSIYWRADQQRTQGDT